jgi:hypothetical protein
VGEVRGSSLIARVSYFIFSFLFFFQIFSTLLGMAVTVSLYSDPFCATEEYSSVTSFECDVTDDYFYYYYDDKSTDGENVGEIDDDSTGDDKAAPMDGELFFYTSNIVFFLN